MMTTIKIDTIIIILSSTLTIYLLLIAIYIFILSIIGIVVRHKPIKNLSRQTHHISSKSKFKFAIIIPAYNEEKTILDTIRSCKSIDYPEKYYKIFVIADNCTDSTVNIANKEGVICLERHDESKKGKGNALAWAFPKIFSMQEHFDAFLVIDADCMISPNALAVCSNYIANGTEVMQTNDISSNPNDSPFSYILSIGNFIENELFYLPKSHLGLSVFLRGTGMVFTTDILKRFPWDAITSAEDKEYSILLITNKKRIKLINTVAVSSKFPTTKEQMLTQRFRWASGNFNLGKSKACKLLLQGLRKKDIMLLDTGITLIADSKPLIFVQMVLALLLSTINFYIFDTQLAFTIFILSISNLILYALPIIIGIVLFGLNRKRIIYMTKVPYILSKMLYISIKAFFVGNVNTWKKTPR